MKNIYGTPRPEPKRSYSFYKGDGFAHFETVVEYESNFIHRPTIYQSIVEARNEEEAIKLGVRDFWQDELTDPFWPDYETRALQGLIRKLRQLNPGGLPAGFYAIAPEARHYDLSAARKDITQLMNQPRQT